MGGEKSKSLDIGVSSSIAIASETTPAGQKEIPVTMCIRQLAGSPDENIPLTIYMPTNYFPKVSTAGNTNELDQFWA